MKSRPSQRVRTLDPATVILLKQVGLGVLLLTLVSVLVTGIWYGTRLPALTITTVSATGGVTIPAATVVAAAESVLTGSYLGLVPRRFVYTYPETAVYEAVRSLERVHSVTVSRVGLNQLSISFKEYVPDALWCDSARTDTECWFIDETGYAFARAPQLQGGSLLRYYTLHMEPARGVTVLSAVDYEATKAFVASLGETGWFTETVLIDAVRDVFYGLTGGGELKASLTESTQRTLDSLLAIRAAEEFTHLAPGNFLYIDLRFGNKVFVKEAEEEPIESEIDDSESAVVASTSDAIILQ